MLAQQDSSYELIVHVMDAMRGTHRTEGSQIVHTDLFPDISIGDAPVAAALMAQR